MNPSPHVSVSIDLSRIRANAERVRAQTGVATYAVVKADAYGCGAAKVADAIAAVVDGFYVFCLEEAAAVGLKKFGKPIISLLDESDDPAVYRQAGVKPVVWTIERAKALRGTQAVLSVDTGQQRFACDANEIGAIVRAGEIDEAMTHASRPEQAAAFDRATAAFSFRFRHAAGTALLAHPAAWFNATRPGMALYDGAVSVSTRLVDVRNAVGPIGYTGFLAARHGVILVGYSHGLRRGPCLVNGQRRQIVEVGMQSAFVELSVDDNTGDEVFLLGDGLDAAAVAQAWGTSQQEALVHLAGAGVQRHVSR